MSKNEMSDFTQIDKLLMTVKNELGIDIDGRAWNIKDKDGNVRDDIAVYSGHNAIMGDNPDKAFLSPINLLEYKPNDVSAGHEVYLINSKGEILAEIDGKTDGAFTKYLDFEGRKMDIDADTKPNCVNLNQDKFRKVESYLETQSANTGISKEDILDKIKNNAISKISSSEAFKDIFANGKEKIAENLIERASDLKFKVELGKVEISSQIKSSLVKGDFEKLPSLSIGLNGLEKASNILDERSSSVTRDFIGYKPDGKGGNDATLGINNIRNYASQLDSGVKSSINEKTLGLVMELRGKMFDFESVNPKVESVESRIESIICDATSVRSSAGESVLSSFEKNINAYNSSVVEKTPKDEVPNTLTISSVDKNVYNKFGVSADGSSYNHSLNFEKSKDPDFVYTQDTIDEIRTDHDKDGFEDFKNFVSEKYDIKVDSDEYKDISNIAKIFEKITELESDFVDKNGIEKLDEIKGEIFSDDSGKDNKEKVQEYFERLESDGTSKNDVDTEGNQKNEVSKDSNTELVTKDKATKNYDAKFEKQKAKYDKYENKYTSFTRRDTFAQFHNVKMNYYSLKGDIPMYKSVIDGVEVQKAASAVNLIESITGFVGSNILETVLFDGVGFICRQIGNAVDIVKNDVEVSPDKIEVDPDKQDNDKVDDKDNVNNDIDKTDGTENNDTEKSEEDSNNDTEKSEEDSIDKDEKSDKENDTERPEDSDNDKIDKSDSDTEKSENDKTDNDDKDKTTFDNKKQSVDKDEKAESDTDKPENKDTEKDEDKIEKDESEKDDTERVEVEIEAENEKVDLENEKTDVEKTEDSDNNTEKNEKDTEKEESKDTEKSENKDDDKDKEKDVERDEDKPTDSVDGDESKNLDTNDEMVENTDNVDNNDNNDADAKLETDTKDVDNLDKETQASTNGDIETDKEDIEKDDAKGDTKVTSYDVEAASDTNSEIDNVDENAETQVTNDSNAENDPDVENENATKSNSDGVENEQLDKDTPDLFKEYVDNDFKLSEDFIDNAYKDSGVLTEDVQDYIADVVNSGDAPEGFYDFVADACSTGGNDVVSNYGICDKISDDMKEDFTSKLNDAYDDMGLGREAITNDDITEVNITQGNIETTLDTADTDNPTLITHDLDTDEYVYHDDYGSDLETFGNNMGDYLNDLELDFDKVDTGTDVPENDDSDKVDIDTSNDIDNKDIDIQVPNDVVAADEAVELVDTSEIEAAAEILL